MTRLWRKPNKLCGRIQIKRSEVRLPRAGGGYSPVRGNSPVRGGLSPVRGTSPVPNASSPMRRQPAPIPTFDDLEPFPLGMSGNPSMPPRPISSTQENYGGDLSPPQQRHSEEGFGNLSPHPSNAQQGYVNVTTQQHTYSNLSPQPNNARQVAFGRLSLQQQQQQQLELQEQQQQQQLELQEQQQLHLRHFQQQAQMAGMRVEPTPMGWGAGADHNHFSTLAQAAHVTRGGVDWGTSGSISPGQGSHSNAATVAQLGGWGNQPQQPLTSNPMAPPQRRIPRMETGTSERVDCSLDNSHAADATSNHRSNAKLTDQPEPGSFEEQRNRRQSLQVEDLMNSMSKLQTGDFSTDAKLQESSDTMGTIEPIGAFDSTNMSVTSFSSSTFSVFGKSMGESTDDISLSRGVSRSGSMNGQRVLDIDASMQSMQSLQSIGSLGNLSEVWGSRGISLLDRLVQEERERAALEGGGGGSGNEASPGGLADNPRPVGLMEEQPDNLSGLGASSMSVIRAAFDSARGPDNDQQGEG